MEGTSRALLAQCLNRNCTVADAFRHIVTEKELIKNYSGVQELRSNCHPIRTALRNLRGLFSNPSAMLTSDENFPLDQVKL